jgi:hypothetical protein
MKFIATLSDGTTHEVEFVNEPGITFESVEIVTPNGIGYIAGAQTWNKLQSLVPLDALINGLPFTLATAAGETKHFLLEDCYVLADKLTVYVRFGKQVF